MTRVDEFPLGPDLSILECQDASNECRHGRLPFDPPPSCGCWNVVRVAPVTRLPAGRAGRKKWAA